jgi:hypothetical protein
MAYRSKLSLALFLIVIFTCVFAWNYSPLKTDASWLLSSRRYKSDVLSQQPASSIGELKHIEWDGWGWAGQNTTVYLVFDPTDSLSLDAATHESGRFAGIPCKASTLSRLESQWYAVTFCTNQEWGRCN